MAEMTPMMRQYQEAKRACPDALLLFRMGDFYEMFYDDAKIAARTLNLALTSRDKGDDAVPMAGFPHHQLESYLGKLIAAGLRAAVCEQVEDPKLAKGLVKREVTRIVTPGTRDRRRPARSPRRATTWRRWPRATRLGVAWVELSTGRFVAAAFPPASWPTSSPASPRPSACWPRTPRRCRAQLDERMMVTRRPGWAFSLASARQSAGQALSARPAWKASASPTAQADDQAIRAAGAVLDYLAETQKTSLEHIDRLVPYRSSRHAGDRRGEPPQPGDHPHHPRGPPRGLAAGRARPHGHGHGLAAAGRLAGQSADRRGGDPRPARGRRASWWPSRRWRPICARRSAGSTTSSGCWPG